MEYIWFIETKAKYDIMLKGFVSLHIFSRRRSAAAVLKPMLQSQGQPSVCSSKHYYKASLVRDENTQAYAWQQQGLINRQLAWTCTHFSRTSILFWFDWHIYNWNVMHSYLTGNFLRTITLWQGSLKVLNYILPLVCSLKVIWSLNRPMFFFFFLIQVTFSHSLCHSIVCRVYLVILTLHH